MYMTILKGPEGLHWLCEHMVINLVRRKEHVIRAILAVQSPAWDVQCKFECKTGSIFAVHSTRGVGGRLYWKQAII